MCLFPSLNPATSPSPAVLIFMRGFAMSPFSIEFVFYSQLSKAGRVPSRTSMMHLFMVATPMEPIEYFYCISRRSIYGGMNDLFGITLFFAVIFDRCAYSSSIRIQTSDNRERRTDSLARSCTACRCRCFRYNRLDISRCSRCRYTYKKCLHSGQSDYR